MALKTESFCNLRPAQSLPLFGTAKGERTKTGTVKGGKKTEKIKEYPYEKRSNQYEIMSFDREFYAR